MKVTLSQQENAAGDAQRAKQGFGRVSAETPAQFDPAGDIAAACTHFAEHGFVVLSNCLDAGEIAQLSDIEATSKLVEAYVRSLDADVSFLR